MLAKVKSAAVIGLDAVPIDVEVDIASQGLPAFNIVGLPDKAVEEAKERVRSAIKNSGAEFPPKRITVNLAPADLPKEGPAYDLPIALGILIASGQLAAEIKDSLFIGELSLDGSTRRIAGILPQVLMAKAKKFKKIYLPYGNSNEASVVDKVKVFAAPSLITLFRHLSQLEKLSPQTQKSIKNLFDDDNEFEFDMAEIKGQETAKRGLEIAASGGHNILLKGPPGAGKTLLARTLPSIMPKMTIDESLEVTKIYSVSGLVGSQQSIITERPFRAPHHSASHIGLIGGGAKPKPGEISLAHRGVLFLDEFPEFPRHALEALRQPLEDGWVTISRASQSLTFPAKFSLVAAANPCPCGYLGDATKECRCSHSQIDKYQRRVSGPIIDRIDLHVNVPAVKVEKLTSDTNSEASSNIRNRVQEAREIQQKRFKDLPSESKTKKITTNAEIPNKRLKEFCQLDERSKKLLKAAIASLNLSARAYTRILKLARTIADLEGESNIKSHHLAEALQYRPQIES